jgi:16S rRNA (adenine1518-N6/adenine1519-N6)-dimethyltransferase
MCCPSGRSIPTVDRTDLRGEIRPRKSLGQHYLQDRAALARIAQAAELGPQDVVLEIGPGPGNLTEELVRVAGAVVAVELDDALIEPLRRRFAGRDNLHVVHADILQCDVAELVGPHLARLGASSRYKVVANLPFYITSAVVRRLLESAPRPELLVLMVQLEVAQRMAAAPPDMSILGVSVQFYTEAHIVDRIPPGAFYPPPKVSSAVIRLDTRPSPAVDGSDVQAFFRLVRAGFAHKRKQLRNSLSRELCRPAAEVDVILRAAGISPMARAETLTVEDWGRVLSALGEARDA